MAHLMFLESFDGEVAFQQNKPRPEDLPGFADGFTAGQAAANAQTHQLKTEVAARLSELNFGFAEAQLDMLRGLTPLINAICDQILPAILDDITRSRALETLMQAARADVSGPLTLTLHPDQSPGMQQIIDDYALQGFDVRTDASLDETEILVGHSGQETQLNTAAMISEFSKALKMITVTNEEVS